MNSIAYDTTIEVRHVVDDLVREEGRHSRRSHNSLYDRSDGEGLVESNELTVGSIGSTESDSLQLLLVDVLGEESSEGISLVERRFEEKALSDTSDIVGVDVVLFNLTPELNDARGHLMDLFVRELVDVSSVDSADRHTYLM